mgnify:CR=1 FL=1
MNEVLTVQEARTIYPTCSIKGHAQIERGAVIGEDSYIGNYVRINKEATIGKRAAIFDYAKIGFGCVVGRDAYIGSSSIMSSGSVVGDLYDLKQNECVGIEEIRNAEDSLLKYAGLI